MSRQSADICELALNFFGLNHLEFANKVTSLRCYIALKSNNYDFHINGISARFYYILVSFTKFFSRLFYHIGRREKLLQKLDIFHN